MLSLFKYLHSDGIPPIMIDPAKNLDKEQAIVEVDENHSLVSFDREKVSKSWMLKPFTTEARFYVPNAMAFST